MAGPSRVRRSAHRLLRPRPDARADRHWGRDGLYARFGEAWRAFAPVVEGWVDVQESHGPEGLRDVWREVLAEAAAPRTGHVVQL